MQYPSPVAIIHIVLDLCTRYKKKKKRKSWRKKENYVDEPDIPRIRGWYEVKKRRKKKEKEKKKKVPSLIIRSLVQWDWLERVQLFRIRTNEEEENSFLYRYCIKGGLKRNFHWFLRDFYERKPDFPLLFRRNNGRFVTKTKNGDTWACLMTANLNLGKEGEQCARRRGTVSTLVFSNDPLSPRDTIWLRRISRYK